MHRGTGYTTAYSNLFTLFTNCLLCSYECWNLCSMWNKFSHQILVLQQLGSLLSWRPKILDHHSVMRTQTILVFLMLILIRILLFASNLAMYLAHTFSSTTTCKPTFACQFSRITLLCEFNLSSFCLACNWDSTDLPQTQDSVLFLLVMALENQICILQASPLVQERGGGVL